MLSSDELNIPFPFLFHTRLFLINRVKTLAGIWSKIQILDKDMMLLNEKLRNHQSYCTVTGRRCRDISLRTTNVNLIVAHNGITTIINVISKCHANPSKTVVTEIFQTGPNWYNSTLTICTQSGLHCQHANRDFSSLHTTN